MSSVLNRSCANMLIRRFHYVDATSFAVIERIQIDAVFAFDADFLQYGLPRLNP